MHPPNVLDPRAVCRSLADMHVRLNAIRANPAQERFLPGTTIFMRPGEDNPYHSSAGNRVMVYDPSVAALTDTAAAAKAILDEHGVSHWFLEIGAGAAADDVNEVLRIHGARVWPHVRYPVLARLPADLPCPTTDLIIARISPEVARKHAPEIDSIWGKPGASTALIAATERPGYESVVAFDAGRAVAMGILIHSGTPGGPGYLASGGTHPDFRRRGGQSAIITERLRIAREVGCAVCVSETVLTDPTSTNNLLRADFKVVCEWVVLEIGRAHDTAGPHSA